MTKRTDGGSAFPQSLIETRDGAVMSNDHDGAGLSVRDYFAAKALAAFVAEFMKPNCAWTGYDDLAGSAYNMADAMLRARDAKSAPLSPAATQAAHLATFRAPGREGE